MSNTRVLNIVGSVTIALWCVEVNAGTIITDPAFFGPDATVIDFDELTAGPLNLQIPGLRFSSESGDHIGFADSTDPADVTNRFDDPMSILEAVSGGGAPVSAPHYAAGSAFLGVDLSGNNVSDMRIDFFAPQSAVGMWIVDNDFSDARLRFFGADGALLANLIIPEVAEGEAGFHGFALSEPAIRYLILDGDPGSSPFDSTFIDNLTFVPEPGTLALLGICGLLSLGQRRNAKPQWGE